MLGDIKAGVALFGGIAIGVLIGAAALIVCGLFWALPDARQQGQMGERIVWQEKQRRAEIKAESDRVAAQAAIDHIEADYHQREAERAAQMTALDQALQEEQANAPIPVPGAACRAVVPRSVLDRLRGIGSSAPRNGASVAHPAVP